VIAQYGDRIIAPHVKGRAQRVQKTRMRTAGPMQVTATLDWPGPFQRIEGGCCDLFIMESMDKPADEQTVCSRALALHDLS